MGFNCRWTTLRAIWTLLKVVLISGIANPDIVFASTTLNTSASIWTVPECRVTRWHSDPAHTGQNLSEHILNPDNVNAKHFGKLFAQPLDGIAYAQPLYVPNVNIQVPRGRNNGRHNVVFVATEHDTVYAFDADSNRGKNSQPLWQVSFIDPADNIRTIPYTDEESLDIAPEIGITGTPTIDVNSGTLYVVARTKELRDQAGQTITHYVQSLHAIDIATGAEKCDGPRVLGDTYRLQIGYGLTDINDSILQYPGTGCQDDTLVDGRVVFNAFKQNQRPALVILNGIVYVAWASHNDHNPVHGWIAGFNAKDLSLQSVLNLSPDGNLSTVWMSGAGPAADSAGNLYLVTGNGTFDANKGGRDYGESVVKIFPNTTGKHPWERLTVSDYFTPYEFDVLNGANTDLGSGGPMLVPDQSGPHPHELITAGKEGVVYVLDTDHLGHIPHPGTGPDDSVQSIPSNTLLGRIGAATASMNTPAYWNGCVYYTGYQRPILQIPISEGYLSTEPKFQGNTNFNFPFPTPQISADGAKNGIVWVQGHGTIGILYAYDASNVSRELWNSEQSGKRDEYGASTKFALPIIANGKVYVAGQTTLAAFGLLEQHRGPVAVPTQLTASRLSVYEVNLQWSPCEGSGNGFKIERSTDGGPFVSIGATDAGIACFHDTHLDPSSSYAYRVYTYNSTNASASTESVQAAAMKAPLTDDLLGWWKLGEGTGNRVSDSSGRAHPGAISGEVFWSQGVVGEAALSFHGAGTAPGYVSIASDSAFNFRADQSFSISAWINPANLPSKWAAWVVHAPQAKAGYGLWSNPKNEWVFGSPAGSVQLVGGTLTPGWHHIVCVQDAVAKTRTLYLDGVSSNTGASADASSPGELWIGGAKGRDDAFVDGAIDEVRIYSRAITPAEVKLLSHWRNPPKPTDLTAAAGLDAVTLRWKFAGQANAIFRIERSVDGGPWSDLAILKDRGDSFIDKFAFTLKRPCRYRICAIDESGASDYSNVAQTSFDSHHEELKQ